MWQVYVAQCNVFYVAHSNVHEDSQTQLAIHGLRKAEVLEKTIYLFTEEHTPSWRRHILFEKWTEKENNVFVCKFSLLVPGICNMKSVLQKWHELLEVSWRGKCSYTKS